MQTVTENSQVLNDMEEKQFITPAEKPVYDFFKRVFDLVLATLALVVLSPVFLGVAIAMEALRLAAHKLPIKTKVITRAAQDAKETN